MSAAVEPRLALEDLLLVMALGALGFTLLHTLIPLVPAFEQADWVADFAWRLWLPLWLIGGVYFGAPLLATRPGWFKLGGRFSRGRMSEWGGGFYGAVALAIFIVLELERLFVQWSDIIAIAGDRHFVREVIRNFLDFSLATLMNSVWAAAWPAFHAKAFAMRQIWPAVAIGALVFFGIGELVRRLPRRAVAPPGGGA